MLYITSIEANSISGDSVSSRVYKFTPEISELLEARGPLFAVISLKAASGDLESLTSEILQTLKSFYYESPGDSFNALRKALERIQNDFGGRGGELDLIVTSFVGGVIYSATLGNGEVSILRKGMVANILSGSGPIIVASGYPQEEDLLILATADFFNSLSSNELKQILEKESLEEVQVKLQSTLSSRESPAGGAVLILSFGSEIPPKEETLIVNPQAVIQKPRFLDTLRSVKQKVFEIFPRRNIFVKTAIEEREDDSRKKTTITVGIILLSLLLISIVFGIRQRSIKLSKSKYEARLTQAIHDFDEASSLISLDASRSRELFLSSQETVKTLKNDGVKDERLDELLSKIDSGQGAILKEFKDEPSDFVDLSLLSSGFKGHDLSSSGELVFVLDRDSKRVIQASIENKKSEVAAGAEEVAEGSLIASYEERFFVLTPDGIRELGDKNENVVDKDWEGEALVYAYAGNLYVLDKGLSSISRYPGVSSGFAAKQNWFGSGVTPDLSTAVSWVIDGNVWILTSSGKILKFSLGSPQAFSISGIGQPLNNPTNLYTNENLENIYILDPQNSRLVVVGKDGVYKAQYVSDQLKSATDLVVSEKDKRAVILVGGNLKSIELRH